MMFNKILALLIVGFLILSVFGVYVLVPLIVVSVLFVVRVLADIFWWMKDK